MGKGMQNRQFCQNISSPAIFGFPTCTISMIFFTWGDKCCFWILLCYTARVPTLITNFSLMIHWVSDYFKSLRSKNEQCTGDAWTHGDGRLLHQLTRLRPGAQAKLLMASYDNDDYLGCSSESYFPPIGGQNTGYSKKLILSVKCFSASGKLRWIQTSILLSDCRWLDQWLDQSLRLSW